MFDEKEEMKRTGLAIAIFPVVLGIAATVLSLFGKTLVHISTVHPELSDLTCVNVDARGIPFPMWANNNPRISGFGEDVGVVLWNGIAPNIAMWSILFYGIAAPISFVIIIIYVLHRNMAANSLKPFQEAEYNFLKWLRYTFFREMKRTLILLLLFSSPLIYIGARWHGPVLSIFDGVAPLTKNTQTSAFEITPDQASFIYSDLMNYGRGHWGMVLVNSCTYVDDTSYYFLEYDHAIFGHNELAPSYYAKRFGMRMNGNDGTIYCPVSGEWIPRGYVHITRGEFASKVTAGMTTYLVKRIVGTPFGKESRDGYTIWLYWCKDGEIWVRVSEGEVESVHNIDLNRV